jgi:hypothetical protein
MALLLSLTPVRNSSAMLLILVKDAKTEKASLTSVIDASEKLFTSVNIPAIYASPASLTR